MDYYDLRLTDEAYLADTLIQAGTNQNTTSKNLQ